MKDRERQGRYFGIWIFPIESESGHGIIVLDPYNPGSMVTRMGADKNMLYFGSLMLSD